MADNKKSMQKYNLSLIMRRAWKIYRENSGVISWSDCLKQSWQIAKNGIGINFNDIYAKYYPIVMYFVIGKIGKNIVVDEIVSDTFLKVHEHLNNYDVHTAKLNTWILNIANRKVIDYLRTLKTNKNQNKPVSTDDFIDETGNSTYDAKARDLNAQQIMENNELGNRLNNAFAGLNEKYYELAKMALIERRKISYIAEALNRPENTVKVQIMRVKEILREKLRGVY